MALAVGVGLSAVVAVGEPVPSVPSLLVGVGAVLAVLVGVPLAVLAGVEADAEPVGVTVPVGELVPLGVAEAEPVEDVTGQVTTDVGEALGCAATGGLVLLVIGAEVAVAPGAGVTRPDGSAAGVAPAPLAAGEAVLVPETGPLQPDDCPAVPVPAVPLEPVLE